MLPVLDAPWQRVVSEMHFRNPSVGPRSCCLHHHCHFAPVVGVKCCALVFRVGDQTCINLRNMTTYNVNVAVQMQLRHCMFTVHVHRATTAGYKSGHNTSSDENSKKFFFTKKRHPSRESNPKPIHTIQYKNGTYHSANRTSILIGWKVLYNHLTMTPFKTTLGTSCLQDHKVSDEDRKISKITGEESGGLWAPQKVTSSNLSIQLQKNFRT